MKSASPALVALLATRSFNYAGLYAISLIGGGTLYYCSGDTDVLRFQQSLTFTDGGSNRSPDAIRAIREACGSDVVNPAGPDDPRCRRSVPR